MKDKKFILSIVLSSSLVLAFSATNAALSNPVEYIAATNSDEVLSSSNTSVNDIAESLEIVDSESLPNNLSTIVENDVRQVPFFSQFKDISKPEWRKVGCGIASIAMVIDYYNPGAAKVDELLEEGITANAFLNDAGWTHSGLIGLAKDFGLSGATIDLSGNNMDQAFSELESELEAGPVIASVHYTFEPTNPIPHLVVVNGVEDGKVFYNDPSEKTGGGSISIEKFKSSWKKRYISIWPNS